MPRTEPGVSASPDCTALCGDIIPSPLCSILWPTKNASSYFRRSSCRRRRLLIKTQVDAADGVRVLVKDAGIGLEPGDLERFFEAFYTTKDDGMGVGLSVSRSIIESHGGQIWGRPNEGAGATFCFSIPVTARAGWSHPVRKTRRSNPAEVLRVAQNA